MNEIARTLAPGLSAGMSWAEFLSPLLGIIRNPPGPQDFKVRCAALAHALPDITADMRTVIAQRDLMRASEFWPTPKEVLAVFADALRHKREMAALRLPKPTEPERGPRSMDEILAVRAKAAEARAVLRAAEEPPEMKPVQPRYLSPGQLLRVYEQLAKEGNQAAATRAAAIRKQIEAAA